MGTWLHPSREFLSVNYAHLARGYRVEIQLCFVLKLKPVAQAELARLAFRRVFDKRCRALRAGGALYVPVKVFERAQCAALTNVGPVIQKKAGVTTQIAVLKSGGVGVRRAAHDNSRRVLI